MNRQENKQTRIRRQIKVLQDELKKIQYSPLQMSWTSSNSVILNNKICDLKKQLRYE